MSKIEIDASRSRLRVSAEGAVALVLGITLAASFVAVLAYYAVSLLTHTS